MLKQLNWLFQTLIYFLVESSIVAMIGWIIWHFILIQRFGFEFYYHEWILMIFIIKLIYNNLFATMRVAENAHTQGKLELEYQKQQEKLKED